MKVPENVRVLDCFVDFVINCFSVGLTNVTKKPDIKSDVYL